MSQFVSLMGRVTGYIQKCTQEIGGGKHRYGHESLDPRCNLTKATEHPLANAPSWVNTHPSYPDIRSNIPDQFLRGQEIVATIHVHQQHTLAHSKQTYYTGLDTDWPSASRT